MSDVKLDRLVFQWEEEISRFASTHEHLLPYHLHVSDAVPLQHVAGMILWLEGAAPRIRSISSPLQRPFSRLIVLTNGDAHFFSPVILCAQSGLFVIVSMYEIAVQLPVP